MTFPRLFGQTSTLQHTIITMVYLLAFHVGGCASTQPSRHRSVQPTRVQIGMASWYGGRFDGRKTASGQIFSRHGLTAAHQSLPFGTVVRVTNRNNGRHVIVRINDRGPYRRGRIIDLSEAAARRIGLYETGVAPVRIEILHIPSKR